MKNVSYISNAKCFTEEKKYFQFKKHNLFHSEGHISNSIKYQYVEFYF